MSYDKLGLKTLQVTTVPEIKKFDRDNGILLIFDNNYFL